MRLASFLEGTRLALDHVRANKTRSVLTSLGIVVGVATVMAVSAIISGVRSSILSAITASGLVNFTVMRYDPYVPRNPNLAGPSWGRNPPITVEEARRIGSLDRLQGAVPAVNAAGDVVYRGRRIRRVAVRGYGAGWPRIAPASIVAGRNFLPREVAAAHPVALLTPRLAQELFGPVDPVGRRLRISGQAFEVLGVIRLPDNLVMNQVGHIILVPFTAAIKYLATAEESLWVEAVPAQGVTQERAMDQVTVLLRSMRGLRPGEPNDFAYVRAQQGVDEFNQLSGIFFVVMLALSSVALVVGGVGVVAVMTIVVTERTREIGIRKAMGATRHEILWQFLVEAVTLTLIGACAGMLLGGGTALGVATLTPVPARVPLFGLVGALVMAGVAGVVFGIWPAFRAARMDPVDALRYE